MDLTQLQTLLGAILVFLLSFIKIPKIELNVWAWIGKTIANGINKDVLAELKDMNADITHVKEEVKEFRGEVDRFRQEFLAYKADDEETELKKMQGMLDIFLELVIPFLDGVYDLETYISVIHSEKPIITDSFVTEEEKQKYGNYYKHVSMYKVLDQYAMLLKAFRDGSFRTSEKMVSDFVRREHRRSLLHGPYLSIETLINWYFKDFYKCYSNNDLNWIVPVYEEKCAEMKQKLLDELKLKIE